MLLQSILFPHIQIRGTRNFGCEDMKSEAQEFWMAFLKKISLTALISQFYSIPFFLLQLAYHGRNVVNSFDRQEFCNEKVMGLAWISPRLITQQMFYRTWL